MTKVINLYGGPGTGKSTAAAYLFYQLKQNGFNVELVREYVKDWAWEGRHIGPFDQFYFFGKQSRRESLLYGKVDYIVTDCPVMLGRYYGQKFCSPVVAEGISEAVKAFYLAAKENQVEHYHFFLQRLKAYNPAGRYQTEEQAKEMDRELLLNLQSACSFIKYEQVLGNELGYGSIINKVVL